MSLDGLQLVAGEIGVLHKGDHGNAADQLSVLIDGIHIGKVEVIDLPAGDMGHGLAGFQHIRQPCAGTQIPQHIALHRVKIAAQFFFQKGPVSAVAEYQTAVGVDDGDALIQCIKHAAGGFVEMQHKNPPWK